MLPQDVLSMAFDEVGKSDVIIVAGTSAVVQPAASLPLIVKKNGGVIIEINPTETPLSSIADYSLRSPAGEAMKEITKLIMD
jgi:NAD-dependent deacetylase